MKRIVLVFFISVAVVLFIFLIFGTTNDNKISYDLLIQFNEKNEVELKNRIVENVLTASGKFEWLESVHNSSLSILFGDVCGRKEHEAILIIKLSEKASVISIYRKEKENFVFDSLVDTFFNIKDVQLLKLKETGKDIILVREYVDQLLGAYEAATFIRGYIYSKNDFKLILNLVEDYKAYWNELWEKEKDDPHWLKIEQHTKIRWENGIFPVVHALYLQVFSRSLNIDSKTIPFDRDFNIDKSREVSEKYYWSSKWKHFILFEGYNVLTGQEVAIIEDLSAAPFALIGNANNSYRVKNKNGIIEIIDKSKIKILDTTKEILLDT